MKKIGVAFLIFALFQSCGQPKMEFSNCIKVNPNDDEATLIEKAAHVVPTQRQYDWQKLEFTAFVHFGMNTFTISEWGTGKEDVANFAPTDLDANQWVATAKSGGMKLIMLTAKHHDGFCLWQTRTSEHSVKNAPWKNGKGDVLRELSDAAKKEGLKLGVYLSPADLHEIEREGGTYGNGSKPQMRKIPSYPDLQVQADTIFSYELDDYNAFFMNQLYEVLTQYGEISEVWFDGANPKPGTGQTYNYKAWYAMIRALQPNAVIAIKGPDVRWVGNEAGNSRKNEWSVLPFSENPEEGEWANQQEDDLGSRAKLKNANYLYWYPAETDTPTREGWFYRPNQRLRNLDELLDIWYRSVGNNSVLLLNLSPDRRGLLEDRDVQRITELGQIIKTSFANNLLEKATFIDEKDKKLLDKDLQKSVELTDSTLVFSFEEKQQFNRLVLQENIKDFGQRIEQFSLAVWENNAWKTAYKSGTVGYKKIARFPMQNTTKIKLKIEQSRLVPTLGFVGIYKAPELLSTPKIMRNKQGMVSIQCKTPDPTIFYTLGDDTITHEYAEPFYLPNGGRVRAFAEINNGEKRSEISEEDFGVSAEKWKIIDASPAEKGFETEKAIDGNPDTFWHTPWTGEVPQFPHSITIDLGEKLDVAGIRYLPRQDGNTVGVCTKYRIEGSLDGKNWAVLKKGIFGNMKNNPIKKKVHFEPSSVRFIRFVALESVDKKPYFSMAELEVLQY